MIRIYPIINCNWCNSLHYAIIACVNKGYTNADDIKKVLCIIRVERLIDALAELIKYSILEIDPMTNLLKYSDDFSRLITLSNEIIETPLGIQLKDGIIQENKILLSLFSALGVTKPTTLAQAVQIKIEVNP